MPPMVSTSTWTTGPSTATSSGCARSSRRSTPISARSKPCTVSAIDIVMPEGAVPRDRPFEGDRSNGGEARTQNGTDRQYSRRYRRAFSPLTLRILAVNVLALAILVGGLLYLGRYQDRLIENEMEAL